MSRSYPNTEPVIIDSKRIVLFDKPLRYTCRTRDGECYKCRGLDFSVIGTYDGKYEIHDCNSPGCSGCKVLGHLHRPLSDEEWQELVEKNRV